MYLCLCFIGHNFSLSLSCVFHAILLFPVIAILPCSLMSFSVNLLLFLFYVDRNMFCPSFLHMVFLLHAERTTQMTFFKNPNFIQFYFFVYITLNISKLSFPKTLYCFIARFIAVKTHLLSLG